MLSFRQRSLVLLLCLALVGWTCVGWGGTPNPAPLPVTADYAETLGRDITARQSKPTGPVGRIVAHFDEDHLPDYAAGRAVANGRYRIEVCLSSRPSKLIIEANGIGFAVQDVNADDIPDILVADGLGGSFTKLENNGRGQFISRVDVEPTHWSGPVPEETVAAVSLSSKATRPPQPDIVLNYQLAALVASATAFPACQYLQYRAEAKCGLFAPLPSRGPPFKR
ncbi:MAG: hypothetical protein SNJ67_05010 [Chloracidobacterium sp.]